jgi:hypothetical protein
VLAFHEAFADTMALFQHFTYPEVVRHEIAKGGGKINSRTILGDLAKELGRAIGRSEALRSAIGEKPDPMKIKRTMQPHARGAILVAAIFDAFILIYDNRTSDLFRIASKGAGAPDKESLPHDLVMRLSEEAATTASHILTICIRALDYLPPMDITFGDYLRALITADRDMVANDRYGYRVAFIEAFKRHGLYPDDVRSLSEESLLWEGPEPDEEGKFTFVKGLSNEIKGWEESKSRKDLWKRINLDQAKSHNIFKNTWNYKGRYIKGLYVKSPEDIFEIHSIRPVRRIGPDGNIRIDMLVEVTQKRPGYFDHDWGGLTKAARRKKHDFWFRGGCTILIDLCTTRLRYCIYKDITSKPRYKRQQKYEKAKWGSFAGRATYFRSYDESSESNLFSLLHKDIDLSDIDTENQNDGE